MQILPCLCELGPLHNLVYHHHMALITPWRELKKDEHCSKVATMLPCPRRVSVWLTSVDADGSPSAMAEYEVSMMTLVQLKIAIILVRLKTLFWLFKCANIWDKRTHCFKTQWASGWYINSNRWRNAKYRYTYRNLIHLIAILIKPHSQGGLPGGERHFLIRGEWRCAASHGWGRIFTTGLNGAAF